jgi:lipoprotein-releasing system permease protein
MYKLFLILRYLRRKLAPMFAAAAVTLCTAMVIIVISVMGGFLDMMRSAAQRLTGQVTVVAGLGGMPRYEQIIERLHKLPQIEAATPVIRAFGLLKVEQEVFTVEVLGIEPQGLDRVLGYRSTLYWSKQHVLDNLEKRWPDDVPNDEAFKRMQDAERQRVGRIDLQEAGMTFTPPGDWEKIPGIVPGIEVMPWSMRDSEGKYDLLNSRVGEKATLTVMPITRSGGVLNPSVRQVMIVNEFKSGLYEVDANRVYVPFTLLQEALLMDPAESVDTGAKTPGRASEIMIKGKPGYTVAQVQDAVEQVVADVASAENFPPVRVMSWQQRHATLLNAVEKEKGLLVVLFAIISVVAIVMIGVIFYMIVLEKTRDIGTLRALGASQTGISAIFLGYGLAIGIVGGLLGLGLAASIVWNLNEIQDLLFRWFGFKMWDPRIYYFERIPNHLNPREVTVIVVMAIASSVLGAIVPAWKASRLNPVEALRYE